MSYKLLREFHDASLQLIDLSKLPHKLAISFSMPDGQRRELQMFDVKVLRVTDVLRQNIISRVMVYSGAACNEVELSRKMAWASSASDFQVDDSSNSFQNSILKIRNNDAVLIAFEPSAGLEAAVVCGSFASI